MPGAPGEKETLSTVGAVERVKVLGGESRGCLSGPEDALQIEVVKRVVFQIEASSNDIERFKLRHRARVKTVGRSFVTGRAFL